MKIGLSLGSGGARGYAHIGVLKALEEAGIQVDLINGSSIGAVVGGAYALYRNTETLIEIVKQLVREVDVRYFNIFRYSQESRPFLRDWLINVVCDLSALRESILSHKTNIKALKLIFGERRFSETKIPFSAVAVDPFAGEVVVIKEGKLLEGVLPSIAIPGIFPPVEHKGRLLVDGGVLADVPVRELRREGAEFIIGVRLWRAPEPWDAHVKNNGFSLLSYVDDLKGVRLSELELAAADFAIEIDLTHYDSMRFDNYEFAIERGYETAQAALPELQRRLDEALA